VWVGVGARGGLKERGNVAGVGCGGCMVCEMCTLFVRFAGIRITLRLKGVRAWHRVSTGVRVRMLKEQSRYDKIVLQECHDSVTRVLQGNTLLRRRFLFTGVTDADLPSSSKSVCVSSICKAPS
jgi:hypothetical protein